MVRTSKAPIARNIANIPPAILLFNDKERKVAEDVVHRMVKRAVEMEGTVTGEHGVGLIKRDYLDHELGTSTVDAMRKVCEHFRCARAVLSSSNIHGS
jgi:FAD/FMN-containing dehydrogenase